MPLFVQWRPSKPPLTVLELTLTVSVFTVPDATLIDVSQKEIVNAPGQTGSIRVNQIDLM